MSRNDWNDGIESPLSKSGCDTELGELDTEETRVSLGRESRAGWRMG